MNALIVLTTSLILSVTICASHVSGRLASHAPSPQLSEPAYLTTGSEDAPTPAPTLSGPEYRE